MRAEIYRPDEPTVVLAVATWSNGRSSLDVVDPSVRGLDALLRPTPVVVDDPSLRRVGTSGGSLLEPGSSEWFRAAVRERAETLGLGVRFVADRIVGGWDPAAAYRRFDDQIDRLTS